MDDGKELTITLTRATSERVRRHVSSGGYASASDVIEAGLEALSSQDDGLESWLPCVAGPTLDRMRADPARGLSLSEVRDVLARDGLALKD